MYSNEHAAEVYSNEHATEVYGNEHATEVCSLQQRSWAILIDRLMKPEK